MSQEQLPDYDPIEQGVDDDRDQRVPASLERRVSLDKMPSAHRSLATQLNESGGTFTGGLAVAAVAGTGEPAAQVRVVIYVRVSTEEQAKVGGLVEGFSIPYQRDACMAEAEKRGWYVVAVYVDPGESARSSRRPKLRKMLKELKVDFVMVHKIDRPARNRSDDVEINNAIAAAGAKLLSVSEPVDDTPAGRFHYNVMADVAQYHSDNPATSSCAG
jgi:site-specific DNA recombinase